MLRNRSVQEALRRLGINPAEVARCLLGHCRRDDKRQQWATRLSPVVPDPATLDVILNALEAVEVETQQ
jgi:hypothetical protein